MKPKGKSRQPALLQIMADDCKAINDCIRKGGDVKRVADDRKIKLATPI